jgi:type VI protein secretion system component VasK
MGGSVTLQVVGALCILVALIGEGLKISEVEVRRLSRTRAVALAATGALFIALPILTKTLS